MVRVMEIIFVSYGPPYSFMLQLRPNEVSCLTVPQLRRSRRIIDEDEEIQIRGALVGYEMNHPAL